MAQGRRPACCCCMPEECLLSGEKKKKQEGKCHTGLKRADGGSSGSKRASRSGLGVAAFGFCFANKEHRSPSGGTVLGFANTKLAASLSGCLLSLQLWLFIYPVAGAGPLAGVRVTALSLCHLRGGGSRGSLSVGTTLLLLMSAPHLLSSRLTCLTVWLRSALGMFGHLLSEVGNYIPDSLYFL